MQNFLIFASKNAQYVIKSYIDYDDEKTRIFPVLLSFLFSSGGGGLLLDGWRATIYRETGSRLGS